MNGTRSRTFEWVEPMRIAAAAQGRTGLAFLQGIIDGEIPQPPIAAALDFRIVAVSEGFARFEGSTAEFHYNPMGSVHGGYACTLLDSAMGCAVASVMDEKTMYTTAQLAVHLTRAITKDTGTIAAEGRIVHRGSKMATAEGHLRDAKGNLLAHGTTTCLFLPRR